MIVDVYWNLHKKCWSVRDVQTGRVVAHEASVVLMDCKFVVQPGGRQRVIREKRKNVHAWVRGRWLPDDESWWRPFWSVGKVTYNPFKYETFITKNNEQPIVSADIVRLHADRTVNAYNFTVTRSKS